MYLKHLYLSLLALSSTQAYIPSLPTQPSYQTLPPLRNQSLLQDSWRTERLATIPSLLRKHGVDAWLMSQREYAEDTAFWSLKCSTQFSARRRTVHLFFAEGTRTEYRWIDNTDAVFHDLQKVLEQHNPASIVVNIDTTIAFAGGMHVGPYSELLAHLAPKWSVRFVSVPMVAVEYIATMPPSQLEWYKKLQETTWALISEAFTLAVIVPGSTTTEEVEWWLREKVQALGYGTWFQPDVSVVVPADDEEVLVGEGGGGGGFEGCGAQREEVVIKEGDMLHVDFGVTALGLNTDVQHLAYVLRTSQGETDVPEGLKEGLKTVNRLQDIVRSHMTPGHTGNTILARSLTQMRREGIRGSIYCHPIGDWGHSAGSVIGMTNLQDGVPVLGDLPLLRESYYSVELYAEQFVPELGKWMRFYQEEDVRWSEEVGGWVWVSGRQEEFHVVGMGRGGAMVVQE